MLKQAEALYDATRDPGENWDLRPDVAGYQYSDVGCNWRIGVLRNVIVDERGIDPIHDILDTPFTHDITRNMARAVVTADLLRDGAAAFSDFHGDLEVLIDLSKSGRPEFVDCYQLIFSRNDPLRQTPAEV